MRLRCNECEKKFNKKVGPRTYEVKCPRCGSYDTEPDHESVPASFMRVPRETTFDPTNVLDGIIKTEEP